MLHKVKLGHFTIDEVGRKRAAFTEVIVEADSGDSAANMALEIHGPSLANPRGSEYAMKVGVCGVDCPTVEEREAWEAGRRPKTTVNDATGHQDEFTARRADVETAVDSETAGLRATYERINETDSYEEVARKLEIAPVTQADVDALAAKPDRMAKARAAKAAKKAAAE